MSLDLTLRSSEEKIEKTVKEIFSVVDTVPVEFARLERETSYITGYTGEIKSYIGLYKLEGELTKRGCSFFPELVKKDFFNSLNKSTPFIDCGTSFYFNSETGIMRKGYLEGGTEGDGWQLVWQNTKYRIILDQNFNPIPYAQWFNYHNTPFSDKYVSLDEEFIDFLKNHPWVVNKEEIRVHKGGVFTDVQEFVEVLIKPDPESYREIWDSFDTNRRRATHYFMETLCGFRTIRDRKSKDWFGILPYLKNDSWQGGPCPIGLGLSRAFSQLALAFD